MPLASRTCWNSWRQWEAYAPNFLESGFLGLGWLQGWRTGLLLTFQQDFPRAGVAACPMGNTWFFANLLNPIDPTFCRVGEMVLTLSRGPNFRVRFCKNSQLLLQWLSALSLLQPARECYRHLSVDLALSCRMPSATKAHNGSFEVHRKCEFIVS